MAMLLQLSLCVVIVIQLTSSQLTYDVIQHHNDVNSCGGITQMLNQLMTVVLQLQAANAQLQKDVADLKTLSLRKGMHTKANQEMTYVDIEKRFIYQTYMHKTRYNNSLHNYVPIQFPRAPSATSLVFY